MKRLAINGRFLTRQTTGVDRYAREIVQQLDALMKPGEAVIVVPAHAKLTDPLRLRNIRYAAWGRHSGQLWEQLDFPQYCRRSRALALNLCNTAPLANPGVVCIHDMAIRANAGNFSRKFVLWYRLMFSIITRRAESIITVSEFSRREIEKYYPTAAGKIHIVPNAWQHIERVEADDGALTKFGLADGSYWFAMSSLSPNKNLRWLVETALRNPDEKIAIAGGMNTKVFNGHTIPEAPNVKYLGYVSDEEAKSLMQHCKGFLYPTFYEGFGIPPMEAMASGAPSVAVSDTEVMHEVYGDSVAYVDPHEPCTNLVALETTPNPQTRRRVLDRYSWAKSARELREVLKKCGR